MVDSCEIPGCRGEVEIVYLDHGICSTHWTDLNADNQPAEALASALGITVALDATTEISMKDGQIEPETEQDTTIPVAEATTEKTMKRKTKAPNAAKPARNAKATATKKEKAATDTKAAKEPKPKKETGPKPDRTFAIRVTSQELDALHAATGPRNATRIVRALTVAFVNEDESQFKSLLKEARDARA